MNVLTELNQLVGKTITECNTFDCDEKLFIKTTDGEYIIFESVGGYDGCGSSINMMIINDIGNYEKAEIGMITQEELESINREARLEREKWSERQERRRYEQLKAKFES